MHDSELLSLFDIINHVTKKYHELTKDEMQNLFKTLKKGVSDRTLPIVIEILSWIPTSFLVMEEHLKVWFIKKIYTESLLFSSQYRTKGFFVLGLGMKDGKRMSSSQGTAILLQDLLVNYGPIKTRMIILMAGGHPSSFYNYDDTIVEEVEKRLLSFKHFISQSLTELLSTNETAVNELLKDFFRAEVVAKINQKEELLSVFNNIEKNIKDGFFKQSLIETMTIFPKTYKKYAAEDQKLVLLIINYYIKILLGVTIVEL